MTQVTFQVLGPLTVRVDGTALPLGGSKRRTVLAALLVSEHQRAYLGELVDAVWDASPPRTAGKQVRNAVSELRSALAPAGAAIRSVPNGYHLDIGEADVDLHRFRRGLLQAHAELRGRRHADAVVAFRTALSAWSGSMLGDVRSSALQAFVVRYQEARLSAAENCLTLELAAGSNPEVVAELAHWVEHNPLRERLVAQYVAALHRRGARAQAFEVYEDTRRRLAKSLGLSPGPELVAVHHDMLRADTGPGRPAPSPLG